MFSTSLGQKLFTESLAIIIDDNDYKSYDKAFPLKDLIKREHVMIAMII